MDWSTVLASGALATLLSAVISGGVSIYLVSRRRDRERRQELWRDKKEQIQKLERWAGFLTEQLSRYAIHQDSTDKLRDALKDIRSVKHTLRRHSHLAQAIRDFVNTAGFIIEEGQRGEQEELREELEGRYDKLINCCDDVLDGDRL